MKLNKITVIGSTLALVASPMAFADKGGAAKLIPIGCDSEWAMAFANKGGAAEPEIVVATGGISECPPPMEFQTIELKPEIVVCEKAPDKGDVVTDETEPTEEGEVTTGGKGDEGAIDESVVDGEEATVDPAVCELADGEAVPLDWVKRGGGDNPEILFNMAGGEAPVFKNETNAATKDLGQDEKATDIEAQDAPVAAQITREKKAPVALVKKGRVFLR